MIEELKTIPVSYHQTTQLRALRMKMLSLSPEHHDQARETLAKGNTVLVTDPETGEQFEARIVRSDDFGSNQTGIDRRHFEIELIEIVHSGR